MRPYPVCQPGGARRGALSPRRWDVFFDCMTKVLTRGDLARSPQFFALLDEDGNSTFDDADVYFPNI